MPRLSALIALKLTLLVLCSRCEGTVRCGSSEGGGICPHHNSCCVLEKSDEGIFGSGCVPSNHSDSAGVCCNDDDGVDIGGVGLYGTACASGFSCVKSEGLAYCKKAQSAAGDGGNAKIQPRYKLFAAPEESLREMHGFPVDSGDSDSDSGDAVLAYYSSLGPIETAEASVASSLRAVVIVVHGSGRTADDYLYSAMAAANLQQRYPPAAVLTIAPRFLAREDGAILVPLASRAMRRPLTWNVTDPVVHGWRYGADALPPHRAVSSYACLDALVAHFFHQSGAGRRYRSLERIAVIGHSAGGQFTHRWALLSSASFWQPPRRANATHLAAALPRRAAPGTPVVRTVVANPRSFCYLDGRRIVNGTRYQLPPRSAVDACPNYNKWEWGLDDGGDLPTPYKDRALSAVGGDRHKIALRYAARDVVYLSGKQDTEELHRSCEADSFQGAYRRQRSHYYFHSLQHYFGMNVHRRLLVDHVGHDHALIFQSQNGLQAIFGTPDHHLLVTN